MNEIVLKWLSTSLICTVVLCSLWLAVSVPSSNAAPRHEAAKPVTVTVVANAR